MPQVTTYCLATDHTCILIDPTSVSLVMQMYKVKSANVHYCMNYLLNVGYNEMTTEI